MVEMKLRMGDADEVEVAHNEACDLVVRAMRRGQVVLEVTIECDGAGEGLVTMYQAGGKTWSLCGGDPTPVE